MQFRVNERVQLTNDVTGETVGGYQQRRSRSEGDEGVITRANMHKSLVRFTIDPQAWLESDRGYSLWVDNAWLISIDENPTNPDVERPRKLGTKPEGEDFIDPKDPRLEWFWDDVSKYAAKSQYCAVFDSILRELGLPPRKLMVRASIVFNGIAVHSDLLARSTTEANELLRQQLAAAVVAEAEKMAEL